ncbi:MAG: trypsin-like peptidase domain-containing protein, partial [Bacteroidota bacterium]
MRQLEGSEMGVLQTAIENSFSQANLRLFLRYRLNKRYDLITSGNGFKFDIYDILNTANMEYWHDKLIDAILAERPHLENVRKIADQLKLTAPFFKGFATEPVEKEGLEKMVRAFNHVNISDFSNRLGLIERTVCSIELVINEKTFHGTGFLIGPDLLLTNYHVMEALINTPETVNEITCLFDYKQYNKGTEVKLADNPIVVHSPYASSAIETASDMTIEWPEGHFDYALVRLANKIGLDPFGVNESGQKPMYQDDGFNPAASPKRHWIEYRPNALPLYPNESLMFIAQHPSGKPMKFNVGSLLAKDANNRRIRYDVNTEAGSSGAPCFNEKLEWVGLHHSGVKSSAVAFNQGIPAATIIADMKAQGFDLLEE